MKNIEEKLEELINLNGISITDIKKRLLAQYSNYLLEFNKKINLISRKDEDKLLERHIIPCLIFSSLFKGFNQSVLDIGTGGGLPGIPFAIINENSLMTLIDSVNKKISAVKVIVQKLGLDNIEAIWTRAEDKNFIKKHENKFDLIISRATADLLSLVQYSKPLLRSSSSKLATMKGGDELELEINKVKSLFDYIAIQKKPLIYLPENPDNINKKFIIIVERIDGRK